MRKKLSIIVLILAICFMMTGCIRISLNEDDGDDIGYEAGDAVIPGDISKIDVEWVGGKIDVVYGDVDEISFTETADSKLDDDEQMYYKVSGSELKIKFARPSKTVKFKDSSKNLTLTIPKDLVLEELSIEAVSADVDIERMSLTRELDIDVVSGNVSAALYGGAEKINADSVSGNIALKVPDEGFTLEFDSVSGKFTSDFATTSTKDLFVYGDGMAEYEVDTVSGDLIIGRLAQ